jgi:hypothetical protein
MPEHYTKNTVSVTVWCTRCNGPTEHRVDNGRRGPCMRCLALLDQRPKPDVKLKPVEQLGLWSTKG